MAVQEKKKKRPYHKKQTDPLAGMVVVKTEKKPERDRTQRNKVGSGNFNTLYRDNYPLIARKLMEAGATQWEVAQDLGVSEQTLYRWAAEYPEFKMALRVGAETSDNRMEMSLYQKAIGYKWTEEVKSKSVNEVGEEVEEVTQITKQLPPDTTSMIFWLKNRRSHRWKDKHEVTVNQNINLVTSNDLHQLIHQHIIDGEYTVVENSPQT